MGRKLDGRRAFPRFQAKQDEARRARMKRGRAGGRTHHVSTFALSTKKNEQLQSYFLDDTRERQQ